MSEPLSEERPHVCAECGRGFKLEAHLASHLKAGHNKDKPRVAVSTAGLRGQLKDAAMMAAVGVLMASGNQVAMANPLVSDALEQRADKFADAWYQIAKGDPRVARALVQLLTGGVWINAIGQSVAFGALLVTFATGRSVVPDAALYFFPELKPFLIQPQASANGDGQATPEPQREPSVPWPPAEDA